MQRFLYRVLVFAMFAWMGGSQPASAQMDLSGIWAPLMHEDQVERAPGPEIGDYLGLPINEAGRLRGETWDASILTMEEHTCKPHPSTYGFRGVGNLRVSADVDDATQRIVKLNTHIQWQEQKREIWMDGRDHPPEYAPHTWQGFSTGRWDGHVLTVTTTHIKSGHLQMNGVALSDDVTLTEYFTRRGNYLTNVTILHDPVYLTEPFIRSSTWELDPSLSFVRYPCGPNEIVVEIPRPPNFVPHVLPGQNTGLDEFAARYGIPVEAAGGGADTMYPEYMQRMKTAPVPAAPKPAAAAAAAR
jgi:hypothetical protein